MNSEEGFFQRVKFLGEPSVMCVYKYNILLGLRL